MIDRVLKPQRVIFSQDQDCLIKAYHRQSIGVAFAGIIYTRQLVVVGDCIRDPEITAKAGGSEDVANRIEYILL
jgi:hypothetical protein